ncbi:hypothetical protein [Comamonas sp. MYb69]|uniref:hypothetical protein n=1 Tax=Comamonas sp. MYb69 TaxID=1848650 RepID=UPI0030AA66D1
MSFINAKHLAHNIRARAHERGDQETAEMIKVLEEIVEGLDSEMRDIKRTLQNLEYQIRNLR